MKKVILTILEDKKLVAVHGLTETEICRVACKLQQPVVIGEYGFSCDIHKDTIRTVQEFIAMAYDVEETEVFQNQIVYYCAE